MASKPSCRPTISGDFHVHMLNSPDSPIPLKDRTLNGATDGLDVLVPTDHDFITYFEFERAHTDDFKGLLAKLRDPKQNPEWAFVDRECEIWMTKME